MRLLLDTHLLIWAAAGDARLPAAARGLIENPDNMLVFSAISILEVAIKRGLDRPDFQINPRLLRRSLLDNGYEELPITGGHAAAVMDLPTLHEDPFDRLLVAQARSEGILLLTSDAIVAAYGDGIRLV